MRPAPLTGTATTFLRLRLLRVGDATRAPHGDCNFIYIFNTQRNFSRCDPRPSRGLQPNPPSHLHTQSHRCDPRPSRGLQLGIVLKVNCNLLDATRAPHGDCNTIACLIFRCVSTRCDPRPSRGLQLQSIVDKSFVLNRCDPRPSRGQKKNGMPGGRHTVFVFCDVKKVECEHHVGLHQMT